MASRLIKINREIESFFDEHYQKSFTFNELAAILTSNREHWKIPAAITSAKFVEFLEKHLHLKETELISENYSNLVRYVWKQPSAFHVAASLRKGAYFSHGSAFYLHSLIKSKPTEIYLNHEQSAKPASKSLLIQANIDRAFSSNQRKSKLTYQYDKTKIVVINGKFSNQLGVEPLEYGDGTKFLVTNLERTLIDITVRPAYAGGVKTVLDVYKRLKGRISVSNVLKILSKLDYVYPYHQSIGFYMEKAGYPEKDLSKLFKLDQAVDFYVTHGLDHNKKFDHRWRVFYPNRI